MILKPLGMTAMKNFLKLTKAFAVHALIFSLVQTSFIFQAEAASTGKTSSTGTAANEILGIANVAVATYGQFLGQKQQMVAQQIAAQKNQALMQSLSPNCRKPDGTACYTVAGKFFPECPLPASMSALPQNVCEGASPDPSAISSMITYESIAKSWENYYEQMQNEASNMTTPFGLKCLADKKKALDSQLIEMQNNLTRLQDQLNKDKETFKANNKKLIDDMTITNDELVGGSEKNNLKLKTKDFAKYFSQSCQSVIGADKLGTSAAQGGLLGIMQSLSGTNKQAADYNSNKTLIEADIRRDIEKSQKLISDNGLEDYLKISTVDTKYGSVAFAIQQQNAEFNVAKNRIAKELSKIGYTLPPLDKNFSTDFDTFLSGSQEYFKKKYVNDCVTGADKSGVAISTEQILSSLKQKSTNSEGTARDKYKAALQTILNSDAFIEDKLAQIKALETNYKDITITYQNSAAQRVTSTPYDLYMKTLAACETRYSQDDTFSTSAAGVSQKTQVARGQNLLRELKSLNDNYTSQLGSRVLEQALNCNGESKKSGAACVSGDANSFDTTKPTFCMSQASQCANEIQGCYSEADKQVQTRKAKLEAQAKAFNANAAALVARSNALYTAQKNNVMDMVKAVQARFPGTNFPIPADMFITMPEMKKDTLGVDLVNDGNLSFMDDLPKKLDLLKSVFKEQQAKVDTEIEDYVTKQSSAMDTQKGKWTALAGKCTGMINTSSKGLADKNNADAKAQADLDKKVRDFCSKYAGLSNHPLGACEKAKSLSDVIGDISLRIVPTVATNVAEFNNVCNEFNNEATSADEECSSDNREYLDRAAKKRCDQKADNETKRLQQQGNTLPEKSKTPKGIPLKSLCSGKDGNTANNNEFIEKAIAKLPQQERDKLSTSEKKNALLKAVTSGDFSDVDIDHIADGDFFANIADLLGDMKSSDIICDSLSKIDKKPASTADMNLNDSYEAAKKEKENFGKDHTTRSADQVAKETIEKKTIEDLKESATPMQQARLATLKQSDEDSKKLADLTAKIDDAKKAVDDANVKSSNPDQKRKHDLNDYLNDLKIAGEKTPSSSELKSKAFQNIGEQVDATSVCDSQAANTNISKSFSNSLLPTGFDEKVLGVSK
jgi:hypothetical protein